MFRIKICGITSVEDGLMAAEAGADAIGLNFYPKSPRYVATEAARRIADALPPHVCKVGLFVNAPASQIIHLYDDLKLDLIQLHGDETPEFLATLAPRPVMRAFRLGKEGLEPVRQYAERSRQLSDNLKVILLDALCDGVYGGSGKLADWETASQFRRSMPEIPLVLAGGLVPKNVAEAIRRVKPDGVDTASGVESLPGRKHPSLVVQFIQAARTAFE